MEKINKGKIKEFRGTYQSGLGALILVDASGIEQLVPCENAPTVRALDLCFGGVIGDAHDVNQSAIAGKEIYWSLDEYGLTLGGFTPVEEASKKLVKLYESQQA